MGNYPACKELIVITYKMLLVTKKPVFVDYEQIGILLVCSATKTFHNPKMLDIRSIPITLSKLRITKVLIRLRICAV